MTSPPTTSRPLVIAAVMASMFMVATEATIVSTAMPQIAAQLGGLRLYSWVFSSFLLTQTAMTVVFGKLSDVYGRKPVMLIGIAIFLIGSILAGFAWSMPALIVFRLVQGIGAGAVQPVALTIVADLYPGRQRGKVQGYLASVWAISAVMGPIVGALIIRNLSWAWVFWINVPLGIAAAAGYFAFLHEKSAGEGRAIDIVGATLFTIAIAALMFVLTEPESLSALVALVVFGLSAYAFAIQERRFPDPMISFALWGQRAVAATNGVAVLSSMALMGLTSFLPMYVQAVLRSSPLVAGLALTTMLVGWPAAATVAARTFHIFGLRRTLVAGTMLIPFGAVVFVLLTPDSSPILAGAGSLVMGFGMGLVSVSSLILIQEIVQWSQRGSVTASNLFARNIGSTLGPVKADELRQLLDNATEGFGDSASVLMALHQALHMTFVVMLMVTLIGVAVAWFVPEITIATTVRKGSGRVARSG
jgi:MFS family permease